LRLIVTEKNIAAKKIAEILAGGKLEQDSFYKIPYYIFNGDTDEKNMVVGLKGHVLKVDFPSDYSDWRKVKPSDLIDAPLIKEATAKSVVRTVKKLAGEADSLVIATDYDREGELIGMEARDLALEANPDLMRSVKRARFSSLAASEINEAFASLGELSEPLAMAGEARQDIDLIWGATLTRFVSLATSRLGRQFLSVGRVQSPTLALIAEREHERRAFKAEPYWVVTADMGTDSERFTATHKEERIWEEERAKEVFEKLTGPGTVCGVKKRDKKVRRPAPFSTTGFVSAATSLGFSAAAAMRVAEGLYMDGYISYPRTDNTVYPKSLEIKSALETLLGGSLDTDIKRLLKETDFKPSRGKKQSTDHPPIYPTGVVKKGDIGDREWRIYELVVRRFLATLSVDAVSQSNRIDLDVNKEQFFVRGSRVVKAGWLSYYPYSRKKDTEIPPLEEGDTAELLDKHLEGKETQPPGRYGQGKLIELMEEYGLGTKATRHNIIQSLYDRGYIHGNPLEPTAMGLKMAEALQEYASHIASPEMTSQLEKDMDAISIRDRTRDQVVETSRKLLREAYGSLEENQEQVANKIWEGITEDSILGPCPTCGENDLRVIRSKKGKRFVGCKGYPECEQTYPLPGRGDIVALHEACPECNTPRIKVLTPRKKPWVICLDMDCPTKDEYKRKKAEQEKGRKTKGRKKK